MKVKNDKDYKDYKTLNQWKKLKMIPKDDANGIILWSNCFYNGAYVYYSANEVRPMNDRELLQLKEENHSKYEQLKERKRLAEHQKRREELEYREEYAKMRVSSEIYKKCNPLGKELMRMASQLPPVRCDNPSKIIVFDVETTGLSSKIDEIIQISIIDGEGNTLIDEYVKPYWTTEWDEVYKIHGISTACVKDCKYPHELIPKVKGIFESADLLIAYDNQFDLSMLKQWGIEPLPEQKQFDVMTAFAPIYGEYSDYFEDYKWQKLTTCAAYYDYEFDAHDSLEDVKATLHCYKKIINDKKIKE